MMIVKERIPKDTLLGIVSTLLLIVAFLLLFLPNFVNWSVYPYYVYLDFAVAFLAIILGGCSWWGGKRRNGLGLVGFILGILYTVIILVGFILYEMI